MTPNAQAPSRSLPGSGEERRHLIVAIVNNELVTQVEVEQRVSRIRVDAMRSGARLPPDDELRSRERRPWSKS